MFEGLGFGVEGELRIFSGGFSRKANNTLHNKPPHVGTQQSLDVEAEIITKTNFGVSLYLAAVKQTFQLLVVLGCMLPRIAIREGC